MSTASRLKILADCAPKASVLLHIPVRPLSLAQLYAIWSGCHVSLLPCHSHRVHSNLTNSSVPHLIPTDETMVPVFPRELLPSARREQSDHDSGDYFWQVSILSSSGTSSSVTCSAQKHTAWAISNSSSVSTQTIGSIPRSATPPILVFLASSAHCQAFGEHCNAFVDIMIHVTYSLIWSIVASTLVLFFITCASHFGVSTKPLISRAYSLRGQP